MQSVTPAHFCSAHSADRNQRLEKRKKMKDNLDAFMERLQENRNKTRKQAKSAAAQTDLENSQASIPPKIEISRDRAIQRRREFGSELPATPGLPQDQHKWLSYMKDFADVHQHIELDDTGSALGNPITVALIDDGFDIKEQALINRVVGGQSFCRNNSKNRHAPYFVTSSGHGTVMANFICQICPKVKLFVLRLDEHISPQGHRQITAESAEKVF